MRRPIALLVLALAAAGCVLAPTAGAAPVVPVSVTVTHGEVCVAVSYQVPQCVPAALTLHAVPVTVGAQTAPRGAVATAPGFTCASDLASACGVVFAALCRSGCYVDPSGHLDLSGPAARQLEHTGTPAAPGLVCAVSTDIAGYLSCVLNTCSGHICRT